MTSMKTFTARAAIALAAATLAFIAPLATAGKPAPLPGDSVYKLALPLTDAQGRTQDWSTLQGKPRVVAMFYTSCQYMCPLIVESGKAVERALPPAERAKVGVVLISLDPKHDTPAQLKAMAKQRHVDPTQWTLAAPAPDDVRKVAGVLGVRYRELADGNFNHTSALVLLDAKGRIVARTEQVGAKPDPEFVKAVRAQL
ncbi:SCO family protein [Lysobacter sp. A6]|uniref:SCO family protein n=1 Tax=Noviluteimonas lactosilytica TaxID=2888523 RepID=A0ABS8JGE5_9GAMM|nr:SCO family protein [Lysobacter lactosilyticus]MCC8362693.1 SCO family protein [Lysobacter lactosilyticus]